MQKKGAFKTRRNDCSDEAEWERSIYNATAANSSSDSATTTANSNSTSATTTANSSSDNAAPANSIALNNNIR